MCCVDKLIVSPCDCFVTVLCSYGDNNVMRLQMLLLSLWLYSAAPVLVLRCDGPCSSCDCDVTITCICSVCSVMRLHIQLLSLWCDSCTVCIVMRLHVCSSCDCAVTLSCICKVCFVTILHMQLLWLQCNSIMQLYCLFHRLAALLTIGNQRAVRWRSPEKDLH